MAYIFQYSINAGGIEPRTDGTGMLNNDLFAQYSEDAGETWTDLYHHTVVTPGGEAQAIVEGANAKANYKELLRQNWDTMPPQTESPPILPSGDPADLQTYIVEYKAWLAARNAANLVASNAADAVNGFVPSWPVTFSV